MNIGDAVIINDFDRPCANCIAIVTGLYGHGGRVYVDAVYVTSGDRCCDLLECVTPLSAFGVELSVEPAQPAVGEASLFVQRVSVRRVRPSTACYPDGQPRDWQPHGDRQAFSSGQPETLVIRRDSEWKVMPCPSRTSL